MDERVVLAGDLELTDSIIQSIDVAPNVDRYLSVTMSFKEDNVSRETLEAITEDFRKFVGVAYLPEEFNFYAEAHLPKVKSYLDGAGALVERKPHIHIVIPKLNLISGGHLEALGFYKSNIQYIEAFQEHVNAKYGLASPKDHRRTGFTSESEMISRYKGDLFKPASRDIKETVLNAMLDRKIERYDDFLALLAEHGEARLRNEGRDNEYANVKPQDALKGVNLKEGVFSRAFIELPTQDKLSQLSADVSVTYEATGRARETDARYLDALAQWKQTRALEVKYLNNGNTKSFPAYRAASLNERVAMLEQRRDAFYSKHLDDYHESGSGRQSSGQPEGYAPGKARGIGERDAGDGRVRGDGRLYEFDRSAGVGSRVDPSSTPDSTRPRIGKPRRPPARFPARHPRRSRGTIPEHRQHGALPDSKERRPGLQRYARYVRRPCGPLRPTTCSAGAGSCTSRAGARTHRTNG
ncbi:hypothetical protein [Burkholderia sp. PAMC 26561]|uniref:hypothetical protein n=1 Tax=Burkholderia sp. PAMC 26561 TaxID=1795043 RepID=UPI0013C49E34|nr:hypothetical protein [Burkholderia sp. PAMC 26561]